MKIQSNTSEFTSQFRMGQEVDFIPSHKQAMTMGITQEQSSGQIVAVKFTEAKVFYDVYDPFYGVIFYGIQSQNVRAEVI